MLQDVLRRGSELALSNGRRVFAAHHRVPVWPVFSKGAHRGPHHTGDLTPAHDP